MLLVRLLFVEEQHDPTEITEIRCVKPKSSSPSWDRPILEARTALRIAKLQMPQSCLARHAFRSADTKQCLQADVSILSILSVPASLSLPCNSRNREFAHSTSCETPVAEISGISSTARYSKLLKAAHCAMTSDCIIAAFSCDKMQGTCDEGMNGLMGESKRVLPPYPSRM